MDLNGYLRDCNGNPVGVAANPIVVTFSATLPQTFHFSEPTVKEIEKIVYVDRYIESPYKIREPKSFFEKIWQKIGIWRGWYG